MKRIGLAALLVLTIGTGARAESGLDLYHKCSSQFDGGQGSVDLLRCTSFVTGFLNALLVAKKISPPGTLPEMCMPDGIPVHEGFVVWAASHPGELARDQGEALAASLFDPASCKRGGPKILR